MDSKFYIKQQIFFYEMHQAIVDKCLANRHRCGYVTMTVDTGLDDFQLYMFGFHEVDDHDILPYHKPPFYEINIPEWVRGPRWGDWAPIKRWSPHSSPGLFLIYYEIRWWNGYDPEQKASSSWFICETWWTGKRVYPS